MVYRPKVGEQITYAGHPLYLFDSGPGQLTGNEFDEPTKPPWHGIWYVMSPQGLPLPWAGTLTTDTINNRTVLAALMMTGGGWHAIPVYADSADSSGQSTCTGTCAVTWPPLLTESTSALINGLQAKSVGTITRSDGTTQVTYDGKPLYLYSLEGVVKTATGYAPAGNGNGVGGFSLVTP
jgi:predicted lipoprotein with Yx(FWY)xxD motif